VNPGGRTTEAQPAVRHLSIPTSEDEILRLTGELAEVRARLESAEFALAHLGPGNQPLERRLEELLQKARADADRVRSEGRRHVQILVAEAEQLRAFARQGAESSARQAREEMMNKAGEMIEDANRLRLAAEETAALLARAAQAKYQEAQARANDLLRSTELAHAETIRKRSEIEQQVTAARAQAQAFVRSSRLEAEARARELTDLARQQLAAAQQQAEVIIRNAEHEARRRLKLANHSPTEDPFWRDQPAAEHNAVAPEAGRINRVDHGRKFGRPQQ
jgi:hypothetical protein